MSADGALRVTVSGWEDGQPMQRELDDPDRWAVQACESVRVCSLPPTHTVTLSNHTRQQRRWSQCWLKSSPFSRRTFQVFNAPKP